MTTVPSVADAGPDEASGGRTPVLEAAGITVRFGGLTALADVAIEVEPGRIAGLVGPNGAGKSTLLGVLSGLLRPNSGRVRLRGEDITNCSPRSRASKGLARTFQQPELFLGLTVREHLVLADRARVGARPSLARHVRSPLLASAFHGGERARQPDPRVAAPDAGGERPGGRPATRRRPPGRGRTRPGERSAGPAPRRTVVRARHEGLGEPPGCLRADRRRGRPSALADHRRARRRSGARALALGVRARLRGAHRGRHAGGDPQRPCRPGRLSRRQRSPADRTAGSVQPAKLEPS